MPLIDLAVDCLAVARLTRLVTADAITRRPRAAIIRDAYRRADSRAHTNGTDYAALSDAFVQHMVEDDADAPLVAEFVTCRWCVSWYCALAVVAVRRLFPRAWSPVARALAFSHAATLLAGLESR